MSGHAETIRPYLEAQAQYESDLTDGLDVPSYAALAALDALLAENQRLRDALERIDAYIASLAYPGPEAKRIAEAVREALAGDGE